MIPGIGYVLGHLRQEIKRFEDLEVALRTGQQIPAGGLREVAKPIVPALVDERALSRDLDHARLAEGTAQEILDQPLQPLGVLGLHPDALIHAEAGVAPTSDVGDDLIGDLPLEQRLEFPNVKIPLDGKRHGVVELIPEALVELKNQLATQGEKPPTTPFQVKLNLSVEKQLLITVTGFNPIEKERFTLSGKINGDPFSMVIFAFYEGILSVSISRSKGENYLLERIQEKFYIVSEPLPGRGFRCGVDADFLALQRKLDQAQGASGVESRVIQKLSGPPRGNAFGSGYKLLGSTATASNPVTVDVMIVYTKEAREDAGSTKKMKNKIDLCLATANEIFEDSKVYVKCNLVHSVEVKYTHGEDLEKDIKAFWENPDLKIVHKLRTEHGADLVSLFLVNDEAE